jgi:hypothetical protein
VTDTLPPDCTPPRPRSPRLPRVPRLPSFPTPLLPRQDWADYLSRLLTGLRFAWQQGVGLPSSSAAPLKRFAVDAAALRLVARVRRRQGRRGGLRKGVPPRDAAAASPLFPSLQALACLPASLPASNPSPTHAPAALSLPPSLLAAGLLHRHVAGVGRPGRAAPPRARAAAGLRAGGRLSLLEQPGGADAPLALPVPAHGAQPLRARGGVRGAGCGAGGGGAAAGGPCAALCSHVCKWVGSLEQRRVSAAGQLQAGGRLGDKAT